MASWLVNQLPSKNCRIILVGPICNCIYSCQNSLRSETKNVMVMTKHEYMTEDEKTKHKKIYITSVENELVLRIGILKI